MTPGPKTWEATAVVDPASETEERQDDIFPNEYTTVIVSHPLYSLQHRTEYRSLMSRDRNGYSSLFEYGAVTSTVT